MVFQPTAISCWQTWTATYNQ